MLYVPDLDSNLLSVKKLTEDGNVVKFEEDRCVISKNNILQATGKIRGDLYELNSKEIVNVIRQDKHQDCIHVWHRRMGHRNFDAVKKLAQDKLADGIVINKCEQLMKCTSCIKGKMTKKQFPKVSTSLSKEVLDLIHSDVCGPMKTVTPSKKKYFLTFIDDYSRYTCIYLLHSKSEVSEKFREYVAYVSNKFGRKPKVLRSDNGTEYTNEEMQNILKVNGIQFQTTVPYNPEQNGVAERKNRTLCESARSMIFDSNLATTFWGEAIVTACYIQNRLPTKATAKTPYELWNKE